jgi:hypothetical protein
MDKRTSLLSLSMSGEEKKFYGNATRLILTVESKGATGGLLLFSFHMMGIDINAIN